MFKNALAELAQAKAHVRVWVNGYCLVGEIMEVYGEYLTMATRRRGTTVVPFASIENVVYFPAGTTDARDEVIAAHLGGGQ